MKYDLFSNSSYKKTGTCVSVEIITKHWHVKPADKLDLYLIFKYCLCLYVQYIHTNVYMQVQYVCIFQHLQHFYVEPLLVIWLIMLNFRLEVYLIGTCRWHFCPRNEVKMVHIFPSIIVTLLAFLFFLPFPIKSSLFTWQSFYKYVLKKKWAKKKKEKETMHSHMWQNHRFRCVQKVSVSTDMCCKKNHLIKYNIFNLQMFMT